MQKHNIFTTYISIITIFICTLSWSYGQKAQLQTKRLLPKKNIALVIHDARFACEDNGYVDDCSGDGDCCPESWIGDGWVDCEDQALGCDLTCYDNDGGDCDILDISIPISFGWNWLSINLEFDGNDIIVSFKGD